MGAAVRLVEQTLGFISLEQSNTADLDLPCATCIGGTALGTISGS